MRFIITKTSNRGPSEDMSPPTQDFQDLEELLAWVAAVKHEVIIRPPGKATPDWTLEVYDDWRE